MKETLFTHHLDLWDLETVRYNFSEEHGDQEHDQRHKFGPWQVAGPDMISIPMNQRICIVRVYRVARCVVPGCTHRIHASYVKPGDLAEACHVCEN